MIVPIKEEHSDYAKKIKETFQKEGLRVIIDDRNESLNKRIREGTIKKIPYLLILGDKEVSENKVAVRKYGEGDIGSLSVGEVVEKIKW